MGFTVGFTVGSVGFKRYLVGIIVTHCGISRSTSQPPLVEDFLFFSESPSSVSRIFSGRHSSLAQLVAQERLPGTRAQTKALLQSVLADKRLGHLLPLGGLADAASSRRS